jgi:hypothetical protein
MRFLPNQREIEALSGRFETIASFSKELIRPHPFRLYGYRPQQ